MEEELNLVVQEAECSWRQQETNLDDEEDCAEEGGEGRNSRGGGRRVYTPKPVYENLSSILDMGSQPHSCKSDPGIKSRAPSRGPAEISFATKFGMIQMPQIPLLDSLVQEAQFHMREEQRIPELDSQSQKSCADQRNLSKLPQITCRAETPLSSGAPTGDLTAPPVSGPAVSTCRVETPLSSEAPTGDVTTHATKFCMTKMPRIPLLDSQDATKRNLIRVTRIPEMGPETHNVRVHLHEMPQVPELVLTTQAVLGECSRWAEIRKEQKVEENLTQGLTWEKFCERWRGVMNDVGELTERPVRIMGPFQPNPEGSLLQVPIPAEVLPLKKAVLYSEFDLETGEFRVERPMVNKRLEGEDKCVFFEKRDEGSAATGEVELTPKDVALSRSQDALCEIEAGSSWKRELLTGAGNENMAPRFVKGGNPSEIARGVVQSVLDSPDKSYTLVVGPPATGKSRMIADLVCAYLSKFAGRRVLVCAAGNAAVESMASRISRDPKIRLVQRISAKKKAKEKSVVPWEIESIRWEVGMSEPASLFGAMIDIKEKLSAGAAGKKVRSIKGLLSSLHEKSEMIIRGQTQVLLSTTAMIAEDDPQFDLVVLDEAGQASELDSFCAVARCARQLVLVGDPQQHAPHSHIGKVQWLAASLMERLINRKSSSPYGLRIQYRCPRVVAQFVSSCFYGGRASERSGTRRRSAVRRREAFELASSKGSRWNDQVRRSD